MRLSGGRPNVRVYLDELRDGLPGLSRGQFDRAMLDLDSSGKASLYRLDHPQQAKEHVAGTVHTPSGEERHIIYMD